MLGKPTWIFWNLPQVQPNVQNQPEPPAKHKIAQLVVRISNSRILGVVNKNIEWLRTAYAFLSHYMIPHIEGNSSYFNSCQIIPPVHFVQSTLCGPHIIFLNKYLLMFALSIGTLKGLSNYPVFVVPRTGIGLICSSNQEAALVRAANVARKRTYPLNTPVVGKLTMVRVKCHYP